MSVKTHDLNDRARSHRRHVLGFGALIALALLLIGGIANAVYAVRSDRNAERWQLHTMEVLLAAEKLRSAATESVRGERGFLITGDARFLAPYERGSRDAPGLLRDLETLTADNPAQRANVATIRTRLERILDFVRHTVELARAGRSDEAVRGVRSGIGRQGIMDVLAAINAFEARERELLEERRSAALTTRERSELAGVALAVLAVAMLGVVGWAGVTASRARMYTLTIEEQLRVAATTDELTGLLNRRAFLAALDTEIARSERSGSPLALALIDLDHFKSINDRFGHAGGDAVLKRFAEIMRETMRVGDVIGRLGGEEFAVLMPDTDQVASGIAGERLRDAVARRHIILETGALVPLTISVGVAHHIASQPRDRLIIRADEALYDAKDSGRNRTRLAA